jgi:hypothetical protein
MLPHRRNKFEREVLVEGYLSELIAGRQTGQGRTGECYLFMQKGVFKTIFFLPLISKTFFCLRFTKISYRSSRLNIYRTYNMTHRSNYS